MDRMYQSQYGRSLMCSKLDSFYCRLGIEAMLYNTYEELTNELSKQDHQQVIVIGIHQRHAMDHSSDLAEYDSFLRWCAHASCAGTLITPYTNFMHCANLVQHLAVHRVPGMFVPMSDATKYVNCKPWIDWRDTVLASQQ